jgi:hypothetical protein
MQASSTLQTAEIRGGRGTRHADVPPSLFSLKPTTKKGATQLKMAGDQCGPAALLSRPGGGVPLAMSRALKVCGKRAYLLITERLRDRGHDGIVSPPIPVVGQGADEVSWVQPRNRVNTLVHRNPFDFRRLSVSAVQMAGGAFACKIFAQPEKPFVPGRGPGLCGLHTEQNGCQPAYRREKGAESEGSDRAPLMLDFAGRHRNAYTGRR